MTPSCHRRVEECPAVGSKFPPRLYRRALVCSARERAAVVDEVSNGLDRLPVFQTWGRHRRLQRRPPGAGQEGTGRCSDGQRCLAAGHKLLTVT